MANLTKKESDRLAELRRDGFIEIGHLDNRYSAPFFGLEEKGLVVRGVKTFAGKRRNVWLLVDK